MGLTGTAPGRGLGYCSFSPSLLLALAANVERHGCGNRLVTVHLLANIAEVFSDKNISLRYAKIATLDERVEDSFVLYSPELDNPKKQLALKQALFEQLSV